MRVNTPRGQANRDPVFDIRSPLENCVLLCVHYGGPNRNSPSLEAINLLGMGFQINLLAWERLGNITPKRLSVRSEHRENNQ